MTEVIEPDFHTYQLRVTTCVSKQGGYDPIVDLQGENHQLLESVAALIQARGCTESEAHQLINQVFNQPVSNLRVSVGRVTFTLGALCSRDGINMIDCAEETLRLVGHEDYESLQTLFKNKVNPINESMFGRHVKSAIKYLLAVECGITTSSGKGIVALFHRQKLAAVRLAIKAITIAEQNGLLRD